MGAVLFFGQFIEIRGESVTKKIILKGWFLKNDLLGDAKVGIFEADSLLGWRHKPLATGRHFVPYGFKVRYHIDESGYRLTKCRSNDLPKILFLGCSFTFGHGVSDEETYVSRLAESFPDFKLLNAAAMGYGTTQAWLKLEEALTRYPDIKLVVYGFIGHHEQRNYLRKTWLDILGWRRNPHFEVVNDSLFRVGLSDPVRDTLTDETLLKQKESDITRHLIAAMKKRCATYGIPFLVVHLPDDGAHDFAADVLASVDSSQFLDLRKKVDFPAIQLPVDGHPNAKGHQLMAELMAPTINILLSQKAQ